MWHCPASDLRPGPNRRTGLHCAPMFVALMRSCSPLRQVLKQRCPITSLRLLRRFQPSSWSVQTPVRYDFRGKIPCYLLRILRLTSRSKSTRMRCRITEDPRGSDATTRQSIALHDRVVCHRIPINGATNRATNLWAIDGPRHSTPRDRAAVPASASRWQ